MKFLFLKLARRQRNAKGTNIYIYIYNVQFMIIFKAWIPKV